MRSAFLIISLLLLSACSNPTCRDTIDSNPINLEVERLEEDLYYAESAAEVEAFIKNNSRFSKLFLDADEYPADSILAARIHKLMQNPSIDTLYQESVAAFEDFDETIEKLSEALGRLQALYPTASIPKVQTTVTGLYKDLIITNEEIIVGMDFFIGQTATFKPTEIPDYILQRYTVEHLPANIIQFISSQYIVPSKSEAMLAEMIDYGKSYYLLSKLLPCTPEHILIGYTAQEWEDVMDNEEIIWANFVQNQIIYETNHATKQKFLGERPNVYEIGEKCPGRIGRWLGWQIVNDYMTSNPNVSIQELMKEVDHTKIFSQSGYKPT